MMALLGLGTATFIPNYGLPVAASAAPLTCLLREAVERGVRYIDTAPAYGPSEALLAELADLLRARQVRLCTKLPPDALAGGIAGSLRRLRCDSVDTLLVHSARRDDLLASRIAQALRAAKESRHASLTGASTYGADDARIALEQPWCDVVQVEHSILNPSVVRTVAETRRPGQEIAVRSVLCKGLLTDRRGHATHLDGAAAATLERLEARARDWGLSLPKLAIRFALDTPGVDIVLVGVTNLAELETVLAAARRAPLEPWQIGALVEFDRSREDWCHPERWPVTG